MQSAITISLTPKPAAARSFSGMTWPPDAKKRPGSGSMPWRSSPLRRVADFIAFALCSIEHKLKLAGVGTARVGSSTSSRLRARTSHPARPRFIRSIVDAGGKLGAPTVVGSMQGRWGEASPARRRWRGWSML